MKHCIQNAAGKKVDLIAEPMFSSVLYGLQLSSFLSLKKKARILVPDSATLIGVVDEDGILEEDEVFVQIRRDNFKEKSDGGQQVLQTSMLVTRNPCTHPGDLRLLKAVDKPELRHLVNVVVFPSKGIRPLCNMMAGGDLDGDVYFICWDQELIKHLDVQMMEEPAKYSKPVVIKDKPHGESLADYFVFYLERDVLGKLANLHLALCDQNGQKGPLTEDCLTLSHLQSVAVDFAKHGECVSKSEYATIEKMVEAWPDFFEKEFRKMRKSDGVLGKLYRDVHNEQAMEAFIRNDYKFSVMLDYQLD